MSRPAAAWVFNLDAEDELARGGPHTPTNALRARAEALAPVLRRLLQPGDEVLWPGDGRVTAATVGRAWCPTPWALAQLRRAGLEMPAAPSAEVLRLVNHRRFAHHLGQALPGARFVHTSTELTEALSAASLLAKVSMARTWLLKRPLGYAGRGRRLVGTGEFTAADRTWVDAALRDGDGLQVEPLVAREGDFGWHGWLGAEGELTLGQPTVATIDASGTWQSTELAPPGMLLEAERTVFEQAVRQTAQALTAAGYFGPFGLDAFRWRAPDGGAHFQPRCEVNARYSMGWAVGMGELAS